MLRFNEPSIYVGVDTAYLTLVRRDRQGNILEETQLSEGVDVRTPAPGLARLANLLEQKDWQGRLQFTLADHYARYFRVQAVDGVRSRAELDILTCRSFEKLFGSPVTEWEICAGWHFPAHQALACALPVQLLRGLMALNQRAGLSVRSIKPFLLREFDQHCKTLGKAPIWFVAFGQNNLTLGYLEHGQWISIRNHACNKDMINSLQQAIAVDTPFAGDEVKSARILTTGPMDAHTTKIFTDKSWLLHPSAWPDKDHTWTQDFHLALAGGWR